MIRVMAVEGKLDFPKVKLIERLVKAIPAAKKKAPRKEGLALGE